MNTEVDRQRVCEIEKRIRAETTKWLFGLDETAKILVRALFTLLPYTDKITREKKLGQPHVMFIGDTGVGKTDLVMSIAMAIKGAFNRIQGMTHLMSHDILGDYIFTENLKGERSVRFRPSKLFANLVLLDESNRVLAEAKSALLEAMEERSVTPEHEHIDFGEKGAAVKKTLPLFPVSGDPFDEKGERFFMVMMTQNIFGEEEGTQPNPRAELDRLALSVTIERPAVTDEEKISVFNVVGKRIEEVTDLEEILTAARFIHHTVKPSSLEHSYRARLLQSTDPLTVSKVSDNRRLISFVQEHLLTGGSPRVNLHLEPVAQVEAFFEGSEIIKPEHIKAAARRVLTHRLRFRPEKEYKLEREFGHHAQAHVLEEILAMVELPAWT